MCHCEAARRSTSHTITPLVTPPHHHTITAPHHHTITAPHHHTITQPHLHIHCTHVHTRRHLHAQIQLRLHTLNHTPHARKLLARTLMHVDSTFAWRTTHRTVRFLVTDSAANTTCRGSANHTSLKAYSLTCFARQTSLSYTTLESVELSSLRASTAGVQLLQRLALQPSPPQMALPFAPLRLWTRLTRECS